MDLVSNFPAKVYHGPRQTLTSPETSHRKLLTTVRGLIFSRAVEIGVQIYLVLLYPYSLSSFFNLGMMLRERW